MAKEGREHLISSGFTTKRVHWQACLMLQRLLWDFAPCSIETRINVMFESFCNQYSL